MPGVGCRVLKRPPSSWASRALFVVLWLLATLPGCDPAAPPPPPPPQPTATLPEVGPVPLGRLPADVRPTHYSLSLRVVPSDERYEEIGRASCRERV